MIDKVAVFVNSNGLTASLSDGRNIRVYKKESDEWSLHKDFPFSVDSESGVKEIRSMLEEMTSMLGDCRIFVGMEISGLAYRILDASGFCICEIDGFPEDFLDYVIEKAVQMDRIRNMSDAEGETQEYPLKAEADGKYYLNLKELSITNPAVTSKQVLMPFLHKGGFYELEVVCSHVPRWFAGEFERMGMEADVIKTGINEYKVLVHFKSSNIEVGVS